MFDPPIFITVRDRVTDLRTLVGWLHHAGHRRITLLDNDSTWPPLLRYLDLVQPTSTNVIYLDENLGPRCVWHAGLVPDEPFIVTDPDLIPINACPLDAAKRLQELSVRFPDHARWGLGLYLDDLPEGHPVKAHEESLMQNPLDEGVFNSWIDTTFALYPPNAPVDMWPNLPPAIRTGYPYMARHMSWYLTELDAENAHYCSRRAEGADGSSLHNWAHLRTS